MKQFTKFIERTISGKMVLGLFILTNIFYVLMLTVTIPRTMSHSNGLKLLDLMPTGYDMNYVRELFDSLGEIGRGTYLTKQIPLDMVYPLLFGLSYCLLLAYFLKKLKKFRSPYSYLCLLPLIAGIADYLENFGIIIMLKSYPKLTQEMVNVTRFFSLTKSSSTIIFFVTLIVILILVGIKVINRKTTHFNNV